MASRASVIVMLIVVGLRSTLYVGGQMACDKKQLTPLAHCLFFQAWLGLAWPTFFMCKFRRPLHVVVFILELNEPMCCSVVLL